MIKNIGFTNNPQQILHDAVAANLTCYLHFNFDHRQSYLTSEPIITLHVCCLVKNSIIEIGILPSAQVKNAGILSVDITGDTEQLFNNFIRDYDLEKINLNQPWPLSTLRIQKPWGAEIWYTGMEDRGICTVKGTPLPWLLAVAPDTVMGKTLSIDENGKAKQTNDPILLKILAPHNDSQSGELYFELHEQKIEVYIVTHIDNHAWPDGVGMIRYGFSQTKLAQYDTPASFKASYLNSVKRYYEVRDKIDTILSTKADYGAVPQELHAKELTLKSAMYEYTELLPVRLGDVIRVYPFFPHALQHGVRVIEFQSAHYERHILSFSQKVLTQDHWDTEAALEKVLLTPPDNLKLEVIKQSKGILYECIADFPEFSAYRLRIQKGQTFEHMEHVYSILMGVSGNVKITSQVGLKFEEKLSAEESFFLPAESNHLHIHAADEDAVILIAIPKNK